jgi:membrane-bound metal-dependent hydrolase YbcI (DUF457 family)
MLIRTHLAMALFVIMLFLPHISVNIFIFIAVALVATLIPDVDSGFSTLGKNGIFKVLQMLTKHRGIFHSFTFCILISIILAFFMPSISLAFFLGYAVHLFADSFTQEGIMPFWPYSRTSSWHFRTGGRMETSLFLSFVVMDLILLILTIKNFV